MNAMTGADETGGEPVIKSLGVTLRLLECMASNGVPQGVTELARQLDESKAKIHRHLTTMKAHGIVEQARGSEKYRLGWRLYRLGQAAFEQIDLKEIAMPHMAQLRNNINLTVVLSIPIGAEALVIASLDQIGGAIKIAGVPGSVAPATASAQGRIMLAYAQRRQQKLILSQTMRQLSPKTLTDKTVIEARLKRIRRQLYEDAPEEVVLGINALAAPVFGNENELVAAVGVLGSQQFLPDPPNPEHIAHVQECAAAISGDLGATTYKDHFEAKPKTRQNRARGRSAASTRPS